MYWKKRINMITLEDRGAIIIRVNGSLVKRFSTEENPERTIILAREVAKVIKSAISATGQEAEIAEPGGFGGMR